jgi:hypothetical protein
MEFAKYVSTRDEIAHKLNDKAPNKKTKSEV